MTTRRAGIGPSAPIHSIGTTIQLRDGRRLGYAEFGDPHGYPLFLLHGFPGSRLLGQISHAGARRAGVRVIAPDRPGCGLSDFQDGRAILDFPEDLEQLADSLGLDGFALMGISGGGPFAAACARHMPRRLTAVGIVNGVAPPDAPTGSRGMILPFRMALALAPGHPELMEWIWHFAARAAERQRDRRWFKLWMAGQSREDRAAFAKPAIAKLTIDDFLEAFRCGARGPAWEMKLIASPWGFSLKEIGMEVHLWHGEEDRKVPPAMGHYQARALPRSRAFFVPGEGHLSLVANHIGSIVETLRGAAERSNGHRGAL